MRTRPLEPVLVSPRSVAGTAESAEGVEGVAIGGVGATLTRAGLVETVPVA
ncbi:MAG TPA: hypothetical protein VLI40_03575 [Gemmatimonadaceae bacterium]|nr:hypothetical protein [Gemmatimonadaceae bacterium]